MAGFFVFIVFIIGLFDRLDLEFVEAFAAELLLFRHQYRQDPS